MRSWEDYKKTMVQSDTPWLAAKEGRLEALARFEEQGCDWNVKDHRGYSPLMLAVYSGQEEASAMLLSYGADANSADLGGNSVLMGAAFKGHLNLVKLLLARGADASRRNSTGMTAQDFAVVFGRREVATHLAQVEQRPSRVNRVSGLLRLLSSRLGPGFLRKVIANPQR